MINVVSSGEYILHGLCSVTLITETLFDSTQGDEIVYRLVVRFDNGVVMRADVTDVAAEKSHDRINIGTHNRKCI